MNDETVHMKPVISFAALLVGFVCTTVHAQENTFRVGMIAMPPAQGNPFFTTGTTPHMFYTAIFDTLTMVNEKGEVVPQIATSWDRIDEHSWTMDIRTDATFSNGEPINADTVVAMVEAFERDDFRTFRVPDEFYFIAGARALDDDTVELTTSSVQALLPRYMSFFYLVPPRHLQENGAQALASDPIGSGPFVVEDWQSQRIFLRANESSWRPPQVARLEALALPQATTRLQALVSGRIDVAINLGPDDEPFVERQRPAPATAQPGTHFRHRFEHANRGHTLHGRAGAPSHELRGGPRRHRRNPDGRLMSNQPASQRRKTPSASTLPLNLIPTISTKRAR